MDEQRQPFPQQDISGQVGSDAAPVAGDVRRTTDASDKAVLLSCDQTKQLLAEPQRENSHVVYCGTEQRLSEGFALALRAMGLKADAMPVDVLPTTSPNKEDN